MGTVLSAMPPVNIHEPYMMMVIGMGGGACCATVCPRLDLSLSVNLWPRIVTSPLPLSYSPP